MNILALAPHTDDVEFGAGASIYKWIHEDKHRVHYVAFSTCDNNRLIQECNNACEILGIHSVTIHRFERRIFHHFRQALLDELIKLRRCVNPDLVLCPSSSDTHQDHQIVYEESLRAFKNCSTLGYELPWNCHNFIPQYFVPIGTKHLDPKLHAISKYNTQANRTYASEDFIRGLAKVRGIQCNYHFAEAFEVIRWIDQ